MSAEHLLLLLRFISANSDVPEVAHCCFHFYFSPQSSRHQGRLVSIHQARLMALDFPCSLTFTVQSLLLLGPISVFIFYVFYIFYLYVLGDCIPCVHISLLLFLSLTVFHCSSPPPHSFGIMIVFEVSTMLAGVFECSCYHSEILGFWRLFLSL